MDDVCLVVVADRGDERLGATLCALLERSGWLDLDAVVVDNGDGRVRRYVENNFIDVRTLSCPGCGIGHANNRALETANARYVLFLDPEAEVVDGSLSALVAALDRRPEVGLAAAGEAALSWPSSVVNRFASEWSLGFILVRKSALDSSGWFDERFFAFAEKADLCLRLRRAGWEAIRVPHLTVRTGTRRPDARREAQAAQARMQFARKHFPRIAAEYRWALALRYAFGVGLYSLLPRYGADRRRAARAALTTVLKGRAPMEERSAL